MLSFAIVLVCYNRINGIKRLVDSLNKSDYANRKDITLILSIDNSGSSVVSDYAKSLCWDHGEKIIRTFTERQGLKKHILSCGDYTSQYDVVVVLEDDIVVSDSFYHYAIAAAEKYWDDDRIAGISLYNFQKNWLNWPLRFEPEKNAYDNYFMQIAQSWGQVWTYDKWKLFMEWYGSNSEFTKSADIPYVLNNWPESSWLKYHTRYCIETNRFFVYPYFSLSTNCGDAGEHSRYCSSNYQVELQCNKTNFVLSDFDDNAICYDAYMNRIGLQRFLSVKDGITVDMYGTKTMKAERYILTTKVLNFKVVESYSLSFRPIEYSVIHNLKGDGIFLYDTQYRMKSRNRLNHFYSLMEYENRCSSFKAYSRFSFFLFFKWIRVKLQNKNTI